jgi:glycosyltransferase involved in cell wall biosynthesis
VRTGEFRLRPAERQRRREALRGSLGIGQQETVLLTLSRLTWDKGYREMIEAAQRLKADGLPCKFLAAGSGKDERAIAEAIGQAQLGSDFVLLGWRDDVVDLHCGADIFVFASHREGLPIAPIEAMASGLPVVASDISGCSEEIQDGDSGLLYPVGDAEALARQIRRLLEDSALAENLAEGARRRARAFDLQRVLDRQIELYRELAGTR